MQRSELARDHMKQRRFDDAILAFEEQLVEHPDDLQSLLELGLCHLLGRSKATFVVIHGVARRLLTGLDQVPEELDRTWRTYRELFATVTASSLLLAACTPHFDNAVEVSAVGLPVVDQAQVVSMREFLIPDPSPTEREAKAMDKVMEALVDGDAQDDDYLHRIPHSYALVEISPRRVALSGQPVMPLIHGIIPEGAKRKGQLITDLYDGMLELAESAKRFAERTGSSEHEFRGRVLLVVDRDVPFETVRMVMYTAGQAQFSEFSFLVREPSPEGEPVIETAAQVPSLRSSEEQSVEDMLALATRGGPQLTVLVGEGGHELHYAEGSGRGMLIRTRGIATGDAAADLFEDGGAMVQDLDAALAQVSSGEPTEPEETTEPGQPARAEESLLLALIGREEMPEPATRGEPAEPVLPVEPAERWEHVSVRVPCRDGAACSDEAAYDWVALAQAVDGLAAKAGGERLNVILVPESHLPMQILTRTMDTIAEHSASFIVAGGAGDGAETNSVALEPGQPASPLSLTPEDEVAVVSTTLPAITYSAGVYLPLREQG